MTATTSGATLVVGCMATVRAFQNLPRSEFAGFGVLGGILLAIAVATLTLFEAVTARGLWRMRAWARTSVLLISAILLPFHLLAATSRYLRPGQGSTLFDLVQVGLATAGLVYFLRPSVRQAFAASRHAPRVSTP